MKVYKSKTPHSNIELNITRTEKYLISVEIKELLRYCQDNRLKFFIDAPIMSLYMYSRRFPVFCSGMKMREDNYNVFTRNRSWSYKYHYNSFVNEKYNNILEIMGTDRHSSFFEQLSKETKRLFL